MKEHQEIRQNIEIKYGRSYMEEKGLLSNEVEIESKEKTAERISVHARH